MTTRSPTSEPLPRRGELWLIRFDPIEGAEIDKTRPAVVLSPPSMGRLPLRIVVPLTTWQPKFAEIPWLIHIPKTPRNGLHRDSTADCFQVKSLSLRRFVSKLGDLNPAELQEIASGIVLCVGG